ncbi:hypothetical protein J4461_04140 [Candidatus Pacearchaeota archaeon]|nr:hypothetical protein [Candidatus Pacearchaeota archaeon]
MGKQKEIRPYSLYAAREIFQRKIQEGYEEVAFSNEGEWHQQERIVRMCAFYSPDGEIETYEQHEIDDLIVIRASKPFGVTFKTGKGLKERLKPYNLTLGEKRKVRDVLNDIIGWEFR